MLVQYYLTFVNIYNKAKTSKWSDSRNFHSNRQIILLLYAHSVRIAQISLGSASRNMAKYAPQRCEVTPYYSPRGGVTPSEYNVVLFPFSCIITPFFILLNTITMLLHPFFVLLHTYRHIPPLFSVLLHSFNRITTPFFVLLHTCGHVTTFLSYYSILYQGPRSFIT